jgi:hypothetical protein
MIVKCVLNGGLAEIDDDAAAELIATGGWVAADDVAPVVRKARAPRAKVVPADSEE